MSGEPASYSSGYIREWDPRPCSNQTKQTAASGTKEAATDWNSLCKGLKDSRILHPGPTAEDKRDSRNHGWWDAYVCVVFWGPYL